MRIAHVDQLIISKEKKYADQSSVLALGVTNPNTLNVVNEPLYIYGTDGKTIINEYFRSLSELFAPGTTVLIKGTFEDDGFECTGTYDLLTGETTLNA